MSLSLTFKMSLSLLLLRLLLTKMVNDDNDERRTQLLCIHVQLYYSWDIEQRYTFQYSIFVSFKRRHTYHTHTIHVILSILNLFIHFKQIH